MLHDPRLDSGDAFSSELEEMNQELAPPCGFLGVAWHPFASFAVHESLSRVLPWSERPLRLVDGLADRGDLYWFLLLCLIEATAGIRRHYSSHRVHLVYLRCNSGTSGGVGAIGGYNPYSKHGHTVVRMGL